MTEVEDIPVQEYRQKTEWSCGPAALKILLSRFGHVVSEKQLIDLTDAEPKGGTEHEGLVNAAKALGYDVFAFHKEFKFALEFKIHKSLSPWHLDKVIPFQEESLSKVSEFGVSANVVLGIRLLLSEQEKIKLCRPTRRVNITLTWSIEKFKELKAKYPTLDIRRLLLSGVSGYGF